MRKSLWLLIAVVSLLGTHRAHAQISCGSGFAASGACSLGSGSIFNALGQNWQNGANTCSTASPAVSGGVVTLQCTPCGHCVGNMWATTKQPINSFSTTFTFVPNDSAGMVFSIQNANNGTSGSGSGLSAGASAEMGVMQFCCFGNPNNIFALKYYRFGENTTQIYNGAPGQCMEQAGFNCAGSNTQFGNGGQILSPSEFAMSPINWSNNGPFTATITYDGVNLCQTVTDTASNQYGPQCFKVDIPALVGANTAYVGFGTSTGSNNSVAGTLNNFTFTPNTVTASVPTFAPAAGSYGSTQSVAIQTSTTGAIICYNTTGSPATNGAAACTTGTFYSGPISVPATETLYAVAGGSGFMDSPAGSAAYTISAPSGTTTWSGATLSGGKIR
jgi:hypothetical protein